jgi:hypothetical protein
MRPLLLFFVFALSAGPLLSADEILIDPSDAARHVGQSVAVSGLVVAVFVSKSGNAFINFGDKYPKQTFTGWIPAGNPLAHDPWIKSLEGKTIKVQGVVELYRGKPEIKIVSRDQIIED